MPGIRKFTKDFDWGYYWGHPCSSHLLPASYDSSSERILELIHLDRRDPTAPRIIKILPGTFVMPITEVAPALEYGNNLQTITAGIRDEIRRRLKL